MWTILKDNNQRRYYNKFGCENFSNDFGSWLKYNMEEERRKKKEKEKEEYYEIKIIEDKQENCLFCSVQYKNWELLGGHLIGQHVNKLINAKGRGEKTCTICNEEHKDRSCLRSHVRTHHKSKLYHHHQHLHNQCHH